MSTSTAAPLAAAVTQALNETFNATTTTEKPVPVPPPRTTSLWYVGVAMAVIGSVVGTVGKQLIRRSEMLKEENRRRQGQLTFLLGISFQVVLNPVCDLAGYAMAPASVIAPVTGMDIVWNTMIAPCTLGERLTKPRLTSSVIIFLGASISVVFRQINEVDWTAEYVQHVMSQKRTIIYFLCFGAWYILNVCVFMKRERGSAIRGFSLGATAGTLSGNMWCTKIVSVLVEQCFRGKCVKAVDSLSSCDAAYRPCEAWTHSVSWFVLFGAVFFSVSNLYYVSKGMQQYEALFMVTVFMGSNISTNSLSAIIVLEEMDAAPWWKLCGYTLCILAMMAGMVILTEGEKERSCRDWDPKEYELPEQADSQDLNIYGDTVQLGAPSSYVSGGI